MPGFAYIDFSGIDIYQMQRSFNRAAHIGYVVAANYDKISVTAPAFSKAGISIMRWGRWIF